jgi:hypothetical protein
VEDCYFDTSFEASAQVKNYLAVLCVAFTESHSDSDQEREWEEQQIRKGVSIPAQPVRAIVIFLLDYCFTFCHAY